MIKALAPQSEKWMPVEHTIHHAERHIGKKYFPAEVMSLFRHGSSTHNARRRKGSRLQLWEKRQEISSVLISLLEWFLTSTGPVWGV